VCVGMPYWARSHRDRPSADTGNVREIEGAGQLSLKQDGLLGWVAPGWAADDAPVVGSA
jgi:hypothetical protein